MVRCHTCSTILPEFASGLTGIRGDTYLDGDALAIWPRDEVRGALLPRTVDLGAAPSLEFDAGADAGRTWHLVVLVNNDKLLDRLIDGEPMTPGEVSEPHWEQIHLDLNGYRNQSVVIRLCDFVLVPNRYAGNSYWRSVKVNDVRSR